MIKNYKKFNDGINHLLVGPTKEEIWENIKDMPPSDILYLSIKSNIIKGVKYAMEDGGLDRRYNDIGLSLSCKEGNLELVKYFIERGATINMDIGDDTHSTKNPLLMSVRNDNTEIAIYLIENGAIYKNRMILFDLALNHYNYDLIKYFIEIGFYRKISYANIIDYSRNTNTYKGYMIKDLMMKNGLCEGINHLLVGPTEEEIINGLKDKPIELLKYSINNNLQNGIKYACEHGADAMEIIRMGYVNICSLDTIKFLKETYNVNLNDFSYKISSIIDENNELINTDVFKYLINNGLDTSYKSYIYIRIASYNGYTDIVKLLIEKGDRVDVYDNQAIWQAAMNGHLEVVKLLYDNGADIHNGNDRPLRFASSMGHLEIVKYCLTKNPPISSVETSIEEAIEEKHYDVVDVLNKYLKFNEGINHLLVGPTDEEILNNLKTKYNYSNYGSFGIIEFHRQCVINKITGGPTHNDVMVKLMENELKGLIKSIPNSAQDFFNKIKEDCYKMYSNSHGDVYGKNEIALFVVDYKNKKLYFSDKYIMSVLIYFYGYKYGYIKIQRMVKTFLVNSSWENYTPISCTDYITLKTS